MGGGPSGGGPPGGFIRRRPPSGAPVHELDRAFCLEHGNRCVHIFHLKTDTLTCARQLHVVGFLCGDEWCVTRKHKMDTHTYSVKRSHRQTFECQNGRPVYS